MLYDFSPPNRAEVRNVITTFPFLYREHLRTPPTPYPGVKFCTVASRVFLVEKDGNCKVEEGKVLKRLLTSLYLASLKFILEKRRKLILSRHMDKRVNRGDRVLYANCDGTERQKEQGKTEEESGRTGQDAWITMAKKRRNGPRKRQWTKIKTNEKKRKRGSRE